MMLTTHYPRISEFQTLEELRAYHNERFIRLAYRSMLGRDADAEGLRHYLPLLHQNFSPAEFLTELRDSEEYKISLILAKENISQVVLKYQSDTVDDLFSSTSIEHVANLFKARP